MKNIICFIIVTLLIACKREIKQDNNVIRMTDLLTATKSKIAADKFFSKVTFIQPEETENGLIGRAFRSNFYKNYLIINNDDKAIQVYDKSGKFLFKTSYGKGPGEFSSISDFTIDFDKDEICLLDYLNHKVCRLSFSGKIIGSFPVMQGSYDLCYIGNGMFCFYIPFINYREENINYDYVYVTDSAGQLRFSKRMKRDIKNSPFIANIRFNYTPDVTLFRADYCDTILKITPNGIESGEILNFEGMKMPDKYNESLELHRRYSETNFFVDFSYSEGKYFFTYSYGIKKDAGCVIYDPKDGTFMKSRMFDLHGKPGIEFGDNTSGFSVWPKSVNIDKSLMMDCEYEEILPFLENFKFSNNAFYDEILYSLQKLDNHNDNPIFILGYQ